MTKTLGGFRAALLIGWPVLGAAAVLYARMKGIPAWAAIPLLAAFLLEYPFYLVAGIEQVRERLAGPRLPWLLVASALAPYLLYSLGTGQFHWGALAKLAALAAVVSLWYEVLPRAPAADAGLLCLLAAVLLRKYFDPIYTSPFGGVDVEILGHLMLIHVAAVVLLTVRRVEDTGFGFLPHRRDWAIGLRYFLYFLPVGFPLALLLGAFRLAPAPSPWWKIAATFVGVLWVVALSEEFFFRGLLQPWLGAWMGSSEAGIAAAAVLFGAAHLGFRAFPNWRFAIVAAAAGWFYGRACQRAGSIRASMVAHALTVTAWRALSQ
jgi:membrane protease YdiL (CAAX protease family)